MGLLVTGLMEESHFLRPLPFFTYATVLLIHLLCKHIFRDWWPHYRSDHVIFFRKEVKFHWGFFQIENPHHRMIKSLFFLSWIFLKSWVEGQRSISRNSRSLLNISYQNYQQSHQRLQNSYHRNEFSNQKSIIFF